MRKAFFHASSITLFAMALPSATLANELVFQFMNPNFGGDPLNGTYLFGLAEAQQSATVRDDVTGIGGDTAAGTGGIGGPTIIIPIATADGGTPTVDTDAAVEQVSN